MKSSERVQACDEWAKDALGSKGVRSDFLEVTYPPASLHMHRGTYANVYSLEKKKKAKQDTSLKPHMEAHTCNSVLGSRGKASGIQGLS